MRLGVFTGTSMKEELSSDLQQWRVLDMALCICKPQSGIGGREVGVARKIPGTCWLASLAKGWLAGREGRVYTRYSERQCLEGIKWREM